MATETEFDQFVNYAVANGESFSNATKKKLADAKRFTKATILPIMKSLWPNESDKALEKRFRNLSVDRHKHDILDHIQKTINQRISNEINTRQVRETTKTVEDYKNEIHCLNKEISKFRNEIPQLKSAFTQEKNKLLALVQQLKDENLVLQTRLDTMKECFTMSTSKNKKRSRKYQSCNSDSDSD